MYDIKGIFQSKTVWANIIGALALILSATGIDKNLTDTTTQAHLVDAIMGVVSGVAFVASTIFRITAQHRLLNK